MNRRTFDTSIPPPNLDATGIRARGVDKATVRQVIVTEAARGRGRTDDPVRIVTQFWDFDGNLLAENDPQTGAAS